MNKEEFLKSFRETQQKTYTTANEKGWWDSQEADPAAVTLAWEHAKTSRTLEIHRTGKEVDEVQRPWWKDEEWNSEHDYVAQKIALVHSELSEALVGYLDHSDKIEGFTSMEEELADAVIRMMDMAEHYGWDLAGAILAKMKYNEGRSHMHGGKKF
jgi:NTP pyrophosphatase (non-canonical NTP hydrolase)